MSKIGYKLGASFEDLGTNNEVGFEIVFPHIYDSYEEAEKNNNTIHARMVKEDNEVVIEICQNNNVLDIIKWDEWWKYKCIKLKDSKKGCGFVDANTDYEPYAAKFEEIFKDYTKNDEDALVWHMQYLAYWIEPVEVPEINEEDKKRTEEYCKQLEKWFVVKPSKEVE